MKRLSENSKFFHKKFFEIEANLRKIPVDFYGIVCENAAWKQHNQETITYEKEAIIMMKDVQVTFTGKNLTGNAGLIHVGRFAKKLGLQDILQESLTLERGANATYPVVEVVTMVTLGVLAGVKHMSHLAILRTDSVLRKIFNWDRFPVATTVSRMFKRFTHQHCHELSEAEATLRKKVWGRKWLGRIILDLDSSVRGVFGSQEGAEKGYHPKKKGQRSSHPLFCFLAQTRECFHWWAKDRWCQLEQALVELQFA